MASNAALLYARISSNPEQTQALFRQALQDPNGAMASICSLGDQLGLPVTTRTCATIWPALTTTTASAG